MLRGLLAGLTVLTLLIAQPAAAAGDRRLVLVTLDGLDWTEVFRGADPVRAADRAFVTETAAIAKDFITPPDRARALMPFLHDVVGRQGVLIGDRDHGSCAAVANEMWFSYPGYNEILTGRPDPKIRSNEHGPNRNVSVLEWLNRQPGFKGQVRAVASWSVFNEILNAPASGVPVNAGWGGAQAATPAEQQIARLEAGAPRLWPTVRLDTFTQAWALETLRRQKPKALYIAYGETDDFAHEGHYDQMLWAARRTDAFLAELWAALQADPAYRGRTTLIVTTDHGRGAGPPKDSWRHHGKPVFRDSDAIWIGAIGPGIDPTKRPSGCASQSQVAATGLAALGLDWRAFDPQAAPPLDILRPAR